MVSKRAYLLSMRQKYMIFDNFYAIYDKKIKLDNFLIKN